MATLIKVLAAASMWFILLAPTQAHAQWVTLSMTGITEYGRDDLNLFYGEPGEIIFLAGKPYTLSYTFDTADLRVSDSTPTSTDYSGGEVALTGALTMNGKTYTWTTRAASLYALLELEPEHNPYDSNRDGVYVSTTSPVLPTTGNLGVSSWQQLYALSDTLLAGTGLDQEFAFPGDAIHTSLTSSFEATMYRWGPSWSTWFAGWGTSAT